MDSRLIIRALLLLLLASTGGNAFGAQVLKIAASRKMMAITGVNPGAWAVNDSACIERDVANRVCGQVVKVLPRGVIMAVSTANHDLRTGDNVALRKSGGSTGVTTRSVASPSYEPTNTTSYGARRGNTGRRNDVTLGVELIQPTVHYQRALGEHFSIGLMPIYMSFSSVDGTLKGFGGILTFNYYSKQPFKGWWFLLGAGYYSFSATLNGTSLTAATSESGSTISVLGHFGYRFLFGNSGWNLGLGGGVQYLANPQTASLQFSSILPAAALDIGYAF